jgi:hypothetical protein
MHKVKSVKRESEIQKEILKMMKSHPLVAWVDRANSGKVKVKGGFMQLHENGTPDLIGYTIHGTMIGVEVKDESKFKSKNNGLSDHQILRLSDMRDKGCLAGVACSVGHAEDILNGFKFGDHYEIKES